MVSARTPKFQIAKLLTIGFAIVATFVGTASQAFAAADAGTSGGLVNQARGSNGLPALPRNGCLDGLAAKQAARMAERDAIFHNPNLTGEADAAGCPWVLIGENVGVGPDVELIHKGFMDSSGHKANVLHREYDSIGVAVALSKDGSVFVAHVFADLGAASQPAPQVRSAAPASAAPSAAPTATTTPTAAPATSAPTQAPAVDENEVSVGGTQQVNTPDPNAVIGGIASEEDSPTRWRSAERERRAPE